MKNNRLYFKPEHTEDFICLCQPELTNRIEAIVGFIRETYKSPEDIDNDVFNGTFINEAEAFHKCILIDNKNTFKKNADVFRTRMITKIMINTYIHVQDNPSGFSRLAKKLGISLTDSNEIKELHCSITEILYLNTLCNFLDMIYLENDNPKINNFTEKMKYLLH